MKKLLLSIPFLSFAILGISQVDTVSNNIYQYNRNLGIGTISPSALLSLESNISSGIERNLLNINNLSNGSFAYTGILLKTGNGSIQSVIQDYGINYAASAHYSFGGFLNISNNSNGIMLHANSSNGLIKFYTGHDNIAGAGIERMRINADGMIGIGTKTPNSLLSLESNVSSGIERNLLNISNLSNGNFAYTGILLKTGDGNLQSVIQDYGINYTASEHYDFGGFLNISNNSNGIMLHSNSSNGIIKFYTGHDDVAGAGIERMRINADGMVGIGTTEPSRPLDIAGVLKLQPLASIPSNPTGGDIYMDGNDHILKYHNGNEWVFIDDTVHRYDTICLYDSVFVFDTIYQYDSVFSYDTIFSYDTVYVVTDTKTSESLWSNSDSSLYYEKGNVGIGTSEPNSKLQVADGDIYIEDIDRGIIMKSPNGQCWRGILDDSGNLTFNQIDCPGNATMVTKQNYSNSQVSVYPNPSKDKISINFVGEFVKKSSFSIYDTNGMMLKQGKIKRNNDELDISEFTQGIYVINVNDKFGNIIASNKIVKE